MIKEVEKLAFKHEIIVQAGHSQYRSSKMKVFDFISPDELSRLYEKADYIVTHGGAGSIFQALKSQKKTLVFPRLEKYGEHINDHQLQLAIKLESLGYLLVFNPDDEILDVFCELEKHEVKPYELEGNISTIIDKKLESIFNR